jgi:hypothetical protein
MNATGWRVNSATTGESSSKNTGTGLLINVFQDFLDPSAKAARDDSLKEPQRSVEPKKSGCPHLAQTLEFGFYWIREIKPHIFVTFLSIFVTFME